MKTLYMPLSIMFFVLSFIVKCYMEVSLYDGIYLSTTYFLDKLKPIERTVVLNVKKRNVTSRWGFDWKASDRFSVFYSIGEYSVSGNDTIELNYNSSELTAPEKIDLINGGVYLGMVKNLNIDNEATFEVIFSNDRFLVLGNIRNKLKFILGKDLNL